jgi:hypothetical protein
MLSDDDLYKRISDYEIDIPGAKQSFTQRLGQENRWSMRFADQAIREYKKFLYLAMVCEHEVTPSDEVDQVWHLHLIYSRDYWLKLCADILPRPLHHGPSEGGSTEADRFLKNYRATLASYEREFDEAPPGEIWPPEAIRFDPRQQYHRIDASQNWLLPKPASRTSTDAIVVYVLFAVIFVAITSGVHVMKPFWQGGALGAAISALLSLGLTIPLARYLSKGFGIELGGYRSLDSERQQPRKSANHGGATGAAYGGGCTASGCGSDGGGGCGGGGGGGGGGCGGS